MLNTIVCANCFKKLSSSDFYAESPDEYSTSQFETFFPVATSCCNTDEAIIISGGTIEDLRENGIDEHNEDIYRNVDHINLKQYQSL